MQTSESYIQEGIKTIELMIERQQYRSAMIGCEELLKYDPRNRIAMKLMDKIREKIEESNRRYVDERLNEAKKMIEDMRWGEALAFLTQLMQYTPEHDAIENLMRKANEGLQKQHTKEQKTFIANAQDAIGKLFDEKKFGDVLQACGELQGIDPMNGTAKKFTALSRTGLIEQKLIQHERIVDSGDYIAALELYRQLLAIDPQNEKVKDLARDAQAHINEENAIQYRVSINRGIVRIKKFFRDGELEKALQSCDEVLHLDSKNFIAATFKKKVSAALTDEIGETVLDHLKQSQKKLADEAQTRPDAFITV